MLKYLKQKPVISVLVIVALSLTIAGILLITRPNGHLPAARESQPAGSTSQTTAAEETAFKSGDETIASETGDGAASAVKPAAEASPSTTGKTSVQTRSATQAVPKTTSKATTKPTTKKQTTSATQSSSNGAYADFQARVIALVNEERTSRGLNALSGNAKLSDVATIKSQDMADLGYFDHTSPTYGSPFDMMRQFGVSYRTAGENIAMGQTTPEQVMDGWMNSPGHCANILNVSFTQISVGIAKNSSGRLYWTQMFIG